jgi:hypothetical protein
MTKQQINTLDLKLKELKRARINLNEDRMAVVLCDIIEICAAIGYANQYDLNLIMKARRDKEKKEKEARAKERVKENG